MYIDECGIDRCLFREYGRAVRGRKIIGTISGKKYKRINIVAGICCGQWIAPLQYDTSTDSVFFEFWFEQCLLKAMKRGQYIILDNATFHRKARLTELAAHKKCKVIFLPPYSPDLNTIEKMWAWLKQRLRATLSNSESFDQAVRNAFQVE